ncbi:hypothetical protein B0J17DRAFT_381523 [Rhizoctonia solani]|nr:hypothetical protein B0J17DRAFT_381523 [Rhizoctonia solani]
MTNLRPVSRGSNILLKELKSLIDWGLQNSTSSSETRWRAPTLWKTISRSLKTFPWRKTTRTDALRTPPSSESIALASEILEEAPSASTSSIPSELSQSDRTVSTRSSQIQLPAHRIAPRRVWIVLSTSSRTLPSPNQAPNSPDREPLTQTPNGSGQPSPRRTKHLRWDLPPGPPFLNKLHRLSPGRTSGAL